MSVINEAATLEAAGENRLEGIRQLIMRGKKLAFFERSCAIRLRSLTVLSLSNNSLRDLGSFEPLINLVEVNLNFNAIASLRGLTCPNLERLYLSNNLIASTERIESSFPKLRTLCLFKNIIPDLTSALEPLRGLPDLRWLDLDGNPCSQSRGYRHRVLRCCPRLLELDGEEIGQLDRDLSSLFFEEEKIRAAWESEGGVKIRRRTRPATAPAKGTSRTAIGGKRRQQQQLARAIAESATLAENEEGWEGVERGSQGAEALAKLARLPSGKLLRSDRLNNDPQLLCYLAQGVLADPCGSPRDAVETLRAASEEKRGRCGRGQLKEQVASATAASRQCPSGDGGHGEQREVGGENTGGPSGEETSREHDPGSRSPALHQGQLMAPPGGDLGVEENTRGEDRDISCLATRAGALIAGTEAATKTSTGIGDADGGGATVSLPTSSTPREEVREDGETAASVPSADADRNQELLLPLPPPPLPPAADLDPSNPYATIRKLLKLVENLQLERARYVDGGGEDLKHHHYHVASTFPIVSGGNRSQQEEEVTDISTIVGDDNNSNSGEKQSDDDEDEGSASPPDPRTAGKKSRTRRRSSNRSNATRPRFDPGPPASREDVRRLRLENRNMHLLLVENRELKNQVREQSASAEGARRELATELGRVTGQLRGALRELQEARARLLLLRPAEAPFSSPRGEEINSSRSTGSGVSNVAPALGLPASPPAVDVSAAETGTTALASSSASSCGGGTMSGGWSCSSSGSRATPMEWRRGRRRVPADSGEEEEEEEVTRYTAASTELRERNGMLIAINGVEHHPGEQISREDGDGGGGGGGHDDDGGDEEGTDEELEELFRRNERTLGEIRHDLGLLAFGRARQDLDDVTTDSLQPAQDKHNNSTTNVLKRGEAGVKKQDFPWKTSAILPGEEAETQIGARLAKEHRPRTEGIPTSARKQVEPPGSLHRTKDKAPSSEPPSVSELLLQLRKDSTHNSSDKSNSIDGGSAVARGRADDTGDESREEALSSTKEENRGVAQDKRVEEGRVILVASNARSLLMS